MKVQDLEEIQTREDFDKRNFHLSNCVLQGLSLADVPYSSWEAAELQNSYFLGCHLEEKSETLIRARGATVFPLYPGLPYFPYRSSLYSQKELREGYVSKQQLSRDQKIYCHFDSTRDKVNVIEALARRIHDHAIDDALEEYLSARRAAGIRGVIGVMGGASKSRKDPYYQEVALTTRLLTQKKYLIVSGGGPGMMEAANLGAYFADRSVEELKAAIHKLGEKEDYLGGGTQDGAFEYIDVALKVAADFEGCESLSVPTWFYGHEPTNVFATHVAKYFANSIREDGLLALCREGVLFAPGSAGTSQEIFMNLAQNFYASFGYRAPMVFLGKQRYTKDTSPFTDEKDKHYDDFGLFAQVQKLANDPLKPFLTLTDTADEAVHFFEANPPQPVQRKKDPIDCGQFCHP